MFTTNTSFPIKRLTPKTTLLIASENLCYNISQARVSGPRNFFFETTWALQYPLNGHGCAGYRLQQIHQYLDRAMSELRSAYLVMGMPDNE